MQQNLKIFLVVILGVLIPFGAWANGDIDYISSAIGNGDSIIRPSITLLSEQLDFILRNENYSGHVTYRAKVDQVPFAGTLYFPIFGRLSKEEALIDDFRMSVNGKVVSVKEAPPMIGKDLDLKGLNLMLSDDRFEHIYGGLAAIFQGEILSSNHDLTIDIFYTAPYNIVIESSGDGAHLSAGIVELYYNFSPAFSWATEPVPSVRITFDVSQLSNEVSWSDDWNFTRNGDVFTCVIEDILMREMPPLSIYVGDPNQPFSNRTYPRYQKEINSYPFEYTLTSQDTLFDPNNAYRPENAMDWDLSTAWCSRQEHPTIQIQIPKTDVDWNLTAYESAENDNLLLGIGFGNGYPKASSIWQANRRVKAGKITVTEKGHRSLTAEFTVEDPDISESRYPFNTLQIISFVSEYDPKGLDLQYNIKRYALDQDEPSEYDEMMRIDVTITDTYPGNRYADVCIAEIFPVFSPIRFSASANQVSALIKLTRHEQRFVRQSALQTLYSTNSLRIANGNNCDIAGGWCEGWPADYEQLIADLLMLLDDDLDSERFWAAWVLGGLREKAAIPTLLEALHSNETPVRQDAIEALLQLKSVTYMISGQESSIIWELIDVLRDEDSEVRQSAIQALREFTVRANQFQALTTEQKLSIRSSLIKVLSDKEAEIREEAVSALRDLSSIYLDEQTDISPLIAVLHHDPVWYVRCAAASALEVIGGSASIEALKVTSMYDYVSYVREIAGHSLQRIRR